MQSDIKKRVGILRGGAGENYNSSLEKGGDIILYIHENLSDKYKPVDILVDKDYIWHINGVPIIPADLIHKVDVIWNTTHPSFSNILESLSIPYVGASSFSSLLENNKQMLREHMKNIGVIIPRSVILPVYQKDFDGAKDKYAIKAAKQVHEKFGAPWLVRSLTPDAGMGIHLAKTFPELVNSIEDGVRHGESIVVEEFILGKIAAMHSVSNFRGENIYTFPPDEVFGQLSPDEKEKLISLSKTLHSHIMAKHYLKSNFIVNKRGKMYLTNIEGSPNIEKGSYFHLVCEKVGAKAHHVIEHILNGAL